MKHEYKNKAELEVFACCETHTIYSNEVTANKVVIRVEKMQNKQCVFPGDHLEYTIKIYNESDIDIYDAVFCDDIPNGMTYEPDSFALNGHQEMVVREPYSNRISYKLNEIKANSEAIITFRAIVE